MRTLIAAGHVRDVVGRPIDQLVASAVCEVLRGVEHIPTRADVAFDGSVHIWPERELSTRDEVVVLRGFVAVTDARLVVHPAVAHG